MTIISLIAAVDEAGGLGKDNKLLCHLPVDLQHFKNSTMGKPIIMGRKTFESIGQPLPGRLNIVLSTSLPPVEGVMILDSLEKAVAKTREYSEIMIIGGANVYTQSLEMANRLYITRIHHVFFADVFFPKIDEMEWQSTAEEFRGRDEKNRYDATFYIFERKNIKSV